MDTPSPLELGSLAHARLPRELRDIIYASLWDTETLNLLDCSSQVAQRKLVCAPAHDDARNPICICDTPANIPIFTQAVFVGYSFAREAVAWLYENYTQFKVRVGDVALFLRTDVFHVGLAPSEFQIRALGVTIAIHDNLPKDVISSLPKLLQPLNTTPVYPDFKLNITLEADKRGGSRECKTYALMTTTLALERSLADFEQFLNFSFFTLAYSRPFYGSVDVKPMLGCIDVEKWLSFLSDRIRNGR
jgi:hypothetical protein